MRSTRGLVGAVAVTATITALAAPTALGANGPDGPKGQRSPAAKTTSADCTLPSKGHSDKHEWTSCLQVSASLDRLPSVGQTARLSVTVKASERRAATTVAIDLPAGLEWVSAPGRMTTAAKAAKAPELRGRVHTAKDQRTIGKGETVRYTGVVRAVASGPAQITARATSAQDGSVDGSSDDVFLTVGARGRASSARVSSGTRPVQAPSGVRVRAATDGRKAGLPAMAAGTSSQASAACDTRVTGRWVYQDQNSVWRAQPNLQVQVWDQDTTSSDDLLARGVTDSNGYYNICFDGADDGFLSGTQDVYVKYLTENSIWRVQQSGSPLRWQTSVRNDVTPGTTYNYGSYTGSTEQQRGLHAFDAANKTWWWIPKPRNACWDQDDNSCRQLRINWSPTSTDGTYYSLGGNDVHLAANDPNSEHTVIHEIGHAIMDDVYNDAYPSSPNCNPHYVSGVSSQGCAYTEGWAEWLPATILNDPYFRWPSGAALNLEAPTWGSAGWDNGDAVEGRVAGALIDLSDSSNEAPWDRMSGNTSRIWTTFMTYTSATMGQFIAAWRVKGYPWTSNEQSTLFGNTIDYGFRDPMANYVGYVRPNPVVPHNRSFNSTTNYWQVVAIRPTAGTDIDLSLYDNWSMTTHLGTSARIAGKIDFVAVDSNRRPLGDYYPRANRYNGSGGYTAQLAQGSATLGSTAQTLGLGSNHVAVVRDTYLVAGQRYTFTARPTSSTIDPSIYLLRSTSDPTTWVRTRGQISASGALRGAGLSETFTYTAPSTGWYGFVVTNDAGYGYVNVTRTGGTAAAPAPSK